MKEKICFNCKFWSIEPGALGTKESRIARKLESTYPEYGKCNAEFTNSLGELERFRPFGTLDSQPCIALDDDGKQLFQEAPED